MSERLAATALAIEQARAASAATFVRARWNAQEVRGITRCPHCRLLIVGTSGTLELRAAIHARCCPGGDRAAEWWFPRLVRNDVPPSSRPVLRLIVGGLAKRRP